MPLVLFFHAKKVRRKPKRGWIYCLENPSTPGMVKIGYTTGSVEARMEQLDGTGVPTPFSLIAVWKSRDVHRDEARVHRHFRKNRVREGREFFALPPRRAVRRISRVLGRRPFKRFDRAGAGSVLGWAALIAILSLATVGIMQKSTGTDWPALHFQSRR